ncbi:MAG: GerAB/ArcD/ProY family transporter [Clostridia bacterium]|nr:GerAB/ArcD/ProY family transporter [Clostridia bacterium]
MKERKLGTYQAVAIVVSVMISHIILNLPNHLIAETGSATILNLIYVFIISLFILHICSKIFCLFPNSDIVDICEYVTGKIGKNIFGAGVCIYLLIISAFVIRIFAESLVLIYFPNIDLEIVILIFIAITTLMNLFGFKSIARVALLIIPIILVSMVIIFISSSPGFMPERALPIFGYGIKETFVTGLR